MKLYSSFESALTQADYQLDASTGIWSRPGFQGINYSDGYKVERHIEAVINSTSDLTVFSAELRSHYTDWASTYHLSSTRANILRPFQLTENQDILEIGAGCGALTRYLGECGANVLALEGSLRRSKIARARTHDLPNVAVLAEALLEFKSEQKFDVITLIGVLEYAGLYLASDKPAETMLAKAVSFLKPSGVVIIAIENQLGLKYFAGAPEDHVQVPMYGLEGRYRKNQPQTYGRQILSTILTSSGLTNMSFLAPFPDYKLPISIITENGLTKQGFDAAAFALQSTTRDPQLPQIMGFSPELVWPQIFSNKLGLDLSNSFLVVASAGTEELLDKSLLACHYSTNRVSKYAKETMFIGEQDGEISVNYRMLCPSDEKKTSLGAIQFSFPTKALYTYGHSLSLEFVRIVSRDGWLIDEVGSFLRRYVDILERLLEEEQIPTTLSSMDDRLPGQYFDIIPQNIVVAENGSSVVIDKEWKLPDYVELGLCLFRSTLLMIASVSRFGKCGRGVTYSRRNFITEAFKSAGFVIEQSQIENYIELEASVQSHITGYPIEHFRKWDPELLLPAENLSTALSTRDTTISQLKQQHVDIDALYQSSSWQITAPLRRFTTSFRKKKDAFIALPRLVRQHPHPFGSLIRILADEGLSGIRNRLFGIFDQLSILNRRDYPEWVRRYSTITDNHRNKLEERIQDFSDCPLISIIIPVYNSNTLWLVEAIESVRKQVYTSWELCIADDCSTDSRIRPILENYAQSDSRIKIAFRGVNGHISAASNTALDLAEGSWVALLDHDDQLSEDALFWVVDAINSSSTVRLIYSDEDKIDERGIRQSPYFKPDWNLDLFMSQNIFSHLGVYKKELVDSVGGFRIGFEGSQDYDLALRCIEKVQSEQIFHIPRVLYHWRTHEDSTASALDNKPYAELTTKRALDEHFERVGIDARAGKVEHGFRVKYALPKELPLVTLIIPTRNGLDLIRRCIGSIQNKTTYQNYEILIVDNGSDESESIAYLDFLASQSAVRVLRDDRPFNFSALNNLAVDTANGQIVGLINNDTEVISPEWLTEMVSHAIRPGIGAVGAKLKYKDNSLQHGGVILGLGGVAGHAHKHLPQDHPGYFCRASMISNFSAVTAACLIVRRSIYQSVGGLNEEYLGVAFNDVDLCCRLVDAGYRNVWTPYAELYHHESLSRGYENTKEKKLRFLTEIEFMRSQWNTILASDPAYSPNLTLDYEDFSYAWPPRVDLLEIS